MSAATATVPPSSSASSAPAPAAPALAGEWDRRTAEGTSVTGPNGESLNVNFARDIEQAALGSTTSMLATYKIPGSTEVRLDGAAVGQTSVGAEQWGGNTSGSEISNIDFNGTNFQGAINYQSEYSNVRFSSASQLEAATFVECKFSDSELLGQGRVRSLRGSTFDVDCHIKLDLRGSDVSNIKFRGEDGVVYTAGQLFAHLETTVGREKALETFKEMFRGTIYDRSTNMDPELRKILDEVSSETKRPITSSFSDRNAVFNELEKNPSFANDVLGADGSISQRSRRANPDGTESYVLKMRDADSPRAAVVELVAGRNATDTADTYTLKYTLDGGVTPEFLIRRHGLNPEGTRLLTGADAFKAALQTVRDIERQFRANGTAARMIPDEPPVSPPPSATPSPSPTSSPATDAAAAAAASPGPDTDPVAPATAEAVTPAPSTPVTLAPTADAAANVAQSVVARIRASMTDFSVHNSDAEISPAMRQGAERNFSMLVNPEDGTLNSAHGVTLWHFLSRPGDWTYSDGSGGTIQISEKQKTFFRGQIVEVESLLGKDVELERESDLEAWGERVKARVSNFRAVNLTDDGEAEIAQAVSEIVSAPEAERDEVINGILAKVNQDLAQPSGALEAQGLTPGAVLVLGQRVAELREVLNLRASAREVEPEAVTEPAAEAGPAAEAAPAAEIDRTAENQAAFNNVMAELGTGSHLDSLRRTVESCIDFKTGQIDVETVNAALAAHMAAIDASEAQDKEFARTSKDITYDPSVYNNERSQVGQLRVSLLGRDGGPNAFGVEQA